MRFRELTLHNVGVYRGRHVVDLQTQPGRPVILVGGLNGCGKTTFLDALQLALYGRRANLSNRGNKSWESFLRETISRGVDPKDGASIDLTFEIDIEGDVRLYRVVRYWNSTGKGIHEGVNVFVDGRVNFTISATWAEHIEEILPLEIANLFFFDGEKIESLADMDTSAAVIRTSIHALLGIGTLERLSTDLLALQRRQKPQAVPAALDDRLRTETERLGHVEQDLDAALQRLAGAQMRHREAQTRLAEAEAVFQREGGNLYEQRASLEQEHREVMAALRASEDQLRSLAEGTLPLLLVRLQLEQLKVDGARNAQITAAAQLHQHLDQHHAELMSQLSAEARSELEPLLAAHRDDIKKDASQELIPGVGPEVTRQLATLDELLIQAEASRNTLVAQLEALYTRRDELDTLLAGVPSSDLITKQLGRRDEARLTEARTAGEVEALEDEVQRLRTEQENSTQAVNLAEAERRAAALHEDEVQRMLNHTDRVRTTLAELRQQLIARNLGKLEVATLQSFQSLMRKKSLIRDVHINPKDFTVHLEGATGVEIPAARLSAGERQLLAVALLWGIAKVAGKAIPMVIDTPLGRLDSVHRERLVDRYFPEAGEQVLLLSTDEEINEPLFHRLAPAISATYLLEHDNENHTTSVNPGYWWKRENNVA
ncbi:DNA sulfur modification protein DndD [Kocuria sp. CPCC 205292]|uniref:DNA sulfur modification protein DndD n=1 Tax=Kocuria cellulosilytica TaxID=3071451 RepID=UPI0034D5E3C4